MNSITDVQQSPADTSEELAEIAGGLRATRVWLVIPLVLLAFPPLLTIIVVAALSTLVVAMLATVPVAAIVVPMMLVRLVRAHRRAHRPVGWGPDWGRRRTRLGMPVGDSRDPRQQQKGTS